MQDSPARLASLYRRFDNIANVLDGYGNVSHMMTTGGRVLKEQASLLLTEARQALGRRWERLEPLPEADREALRRTMCDDFAAVLYELTVMLLPALDGTRSNRVPIELEPVLTRLAGRASGVQGGRVVLYASEHLNYSIEQYRDPIAALAPCMSPSSGIPHGPEKSFLFLRIPRIERDSGTLHTVILGHELGHLRDWTHQLSRIMPPILVPASWTDGAGSIAIDHLDAFGRFSAVATSWAAEIVADIVAALMFGPASLQSLSELVGTVGSWAMDSSSHPGADRRAALILKVLRSCGFSSIAAVDGLLNHFTSESVDALNRPVSIDGSRYPDADQAAWELVESKFADFESACRSTLAPDECFTAAQWPAVIDAADHLRNGRPCGERSGTGGVPVPEDDAVILNAAYAVRSSELSDLGAVVGFDATDPAQAGFIGAILDGLVLKSFEVSELRRRTPWK